MMKTVAELSEQFEINGISFAEEWDGFVVIDVVNEQATARVAINGAQLLQWQPKGEEPVVWLSQDAHLRWDAQCAVVYRSVGPGLVPTRVSRSFRHTVLPDPASGSWLR